MGSGPNNNRKSEEKGSQNGASWAVELGGDMKVCPILVEDLQCPGHIVIEVHVFSLARYGFTFMYFHSLFSYILKQNHITYTFIIISFTSFSYNFTIITRINGQFGTR